MKNNYTFSNTLFIFEGIHDEQMAKNAVINIKTLSVNGSAINQETLDLISELSKTYFIILCLDPDHAGNRIRRLISKRLNNKCAHIFLKQENSFSKNKKKIGFEHLNKQAFLNAIDTLSITNTTLYEPFDYSYFSIAQLYMLKLSGHYNSNILRNKVLTHLDIGLQNTTAKSFAKLLHLLGYDYKKIEELINEF